MEVIGVGRAESNSGDDSYLRQLSNCLPKKFDLCVIWYRRFQVSFREVGADIIPCAIAIALKVAETILAVPN